MKITMSVAIAFYDSFTGKQISPELLEIQSKEDVKKLIKAGYFCFLNCKNKELDLRVYAKEYQEFRKKISLPVTEDILHIWLFPKKNYHFQKPPTILEGSGFKKNTAILLVLKAKKPKIRLKEAILENSRKIQIEASSYWEKVGRNYLIVTKGEKREWIHLIKEIEKDCYLLEKPLNYSHVLNEILYSTYEIITDETGDFFLPIGEIIEDCKGILIFEDKKEKQINLRAGEINGGIDGPI